MRISPDALSLPASSAVPALKEALKGNRVAIVTAPPGAGKSTLLPLTLLEGCEGKILMLEPRRMACRQVAMRMSAILGEAPGKTVGYKMRFESCCTEKTRIEVVTEGIAEHIIASDPTLSDYSTVILDEFHERSLSSDFCLAMVRSAAAALRDDLRIVIMSATIDSSALSKALDAQVVSCEGRMFPVETEWVEEDCDERNVSEKVAPVIRQAHSSEDGDILAFLPGEAQILRCRDILQDSLGPDTSVIPLYGMLPVSEQAAAISPSAKGRRKIVLSTSIAETSLTIEGVRIVVDGGFCRRMVFDRRSGLSHLETVRISRDMADQRRGRAGRTAPGRCYRLWGQGTEARLSLCRNPEILEADLAPAMLQTAFWGCEEFRELPWLTPPPSENVYPARELLETFGAFKDGHISDHGRRLCSLGCHPRIAQMLLKSPEKGLACNIAALLEERDPMPQAGADITLRLIRQGRRIEQIASQYRKLIHCNTASDSDPYAAGAAIAAAYPERIARLESGTLYRLSCGEKVSLEASDSLVGTPWLAVASANLIPGGVGKIFLAAPLEESELSGFVREAVNVSWDYKEDMLLCVKERRIGRLVLDRRPIPREGYLTKCASAICEAVRREGTSLLSFDESVGNLQRRIAALSAWRPSLELPDISTPTLLETVSEWLAPYVGRMASKADLKKLDLSSILWNMLDYSQKQEVERLAPSHITVPTGSRIDLEYRSGAELPVLRVRLQEVFGMKESPRVDDGRRPVLMELLSPGYKAVQLTSDLESFWKEAYFTVRGELRRRYPKHAWPDDPLSAPPQRGVRKKGFQNQEK